MVGLSLREPNRDELFHGSVPIDFIEIVTENYSYSRGADFESILKLRDKSPISYHGLTLNLGGMDDWDSNSLIQMKELFRESKPFLITDHICWSRHKGKSHFDLFPVTHTQKMIQNIGNRVKFLKDTLDTNIAFENISTYFRYKIDEMDEIDFYLELQDKTEINFLLDINNLVVNQFNHGIDIGKLIRNLEPNRVIGYHIAGYSDQGDFYFDAHDSVVPSEVWQFYEIALDRIGPRPTTIERDENIPAVNELLREALQAKKLMQKVGLELQNG